MSLAAAPRYYPSIEFLLQRLIPKSVLEGQHRHTQYANEKINRRLDLRTDRPDFMTPFMKNNVDFEKASREEVLSTFNFIIVGGSEITATTLTGIFNHLSRNDNILQRLCTEIRTNFKEEKDITIDATHGLLSLEAVINEGLRMCNPIPGGLPRVAPEDGDTYAGVYLPGGTRLGLRTFAVNRSNKYFADPDCFVPQRRLSKGERLTDRLERPLTWVVLRLVLTRLPWAFGFAKETAERVDFDAFLLIMLIQKEPMKMRDKMILIRERLWAVTIGRLKDPRSKPKPVTVGKPTSHGSEIKLVAQKSTEDDAIAQKVPDDYDLNERVYATILLAIAEDLLLHKLGDSYDNFISTTLQTIHDNKEADIDPIIQQLLDEERRRTSRHRQLYSSV
ncbi:MAG: RNA polymerase II mediator complex subunit [Peltula sp. TS41687]|nr:MAG: RNA polymerase II mediator complex subunit [Peltula sp. TS41687]